MRCTTFALFAFTFCRLPLYFLHCRTGPEGTHREVSVLNVTMGLRPNLLKLVGWVYLPRHYHCGEVETNI